jgi:hypothetical protein
MEVEPSGTGPADKEILRRLSWAYETYPGFVVILKSESYLMRAIYYGALMFLWNRNFMTTFTTTIGRRMYTPSPLSGPQGLALLAHELCHVADAKKVTLPLWVFLYLFPQCLAIGALLAFWKIGFLLCLAFLIPWPAPFRVWAEFRAYTITLLELRRCGVNIGEQEIQWLHGVFCGWAYYRMSWFWTPLEIGFRKIVDHPSVSASL